MLPSLGVHMHILHGGLSKQASHTASPSSYFRRQAFDWYDGAGTCTGPARVSVRRTPHAAFATATFSLSMVEETLPDLEVAVPTWAERGARLAHGGVAPPEGDALGGSGLHAQRALLRMVGAQVGSAVAASLGAWGWGSSALSRPPPSSAPRCHSWRSRTPSPTGSNIGKLS